MHAPIIRLSMAKIDYRWFLELLCSIIVIEHELFLPTASAQLHSLPKVFKYTLIQPRFYHGRNKRGVSTTKQKDGNHAKHLMMSYEDKDESYLVDLQLNQHLITKGYSMKYQKDGKYVHKNNNSKQNVELCHYLGKVRGIPDSWASLSSCSGDGLNGIVYNGNEKHYFQKALDKNGKYLSGFNFHYKHSDLMGTKRSPPAVKDFFSSQRIRKRRYKRSLQQREKVKGPYCANRQSRYVELLVVVDNPMYIEMDKNLNKVENFVLSLVNMVNSLYSPLNIYICLVNILVWTEKDQVDYSKEDVWTAVQRFRRYREQELNVNFPNDITLMMFSQNNSETLGKTYSYAAPETMCTSTHSLCMLLYSTGETMDVAAAHVTYQIGRALGIRYDMDYCICPEKSCIMNRAFEPSRYWSSCSLESVDRSYERGIDYCLRNKPAFLFDKPSCGNGFVDSDEQCDCGLPDRCNNPCCNAITCRFHTNATCATGECCDLNNCTLKKIGTVCRSAEYECDLPEYCTGKSEYCPVDVFKMDTLPCAGGESYCYKGSCRTRSDQCRLLWGETGIPSGEKCYSLNTRGSIRGSCGYNKLNYTYSKCNSENILCGTLHCMFSDKDIKIGPVFGTIWLCHPIRRWMFNRGNLPEQCCTAKINFGLNEIDPSMVPDGAKCGDSKMCVNQTCMAISNLRSITNTCSNNCNGNGICNNLGRCHCQFGYAPPHCKTYGYGGSRDSGPTTDINSTIIPIKPFKTMFHLANQWYKKTKIIQIHDVS